MDTDDAALEEFHLDDYDEDEEGQALHKINYEDADDGQMVEVSPALRRVLYAVHAHIHIY